MRRGIGVVKEEPSIMLLSLQKDLQKSSFRVRIASLA